MKKKNHLFSRSLTFNIVSVLILLLIIFGVVAGVIGYLNFTVSFTTEYTNNATKVAKTATQLVNSDNIDKYLNGEEMDEHDQSQGYLNYLCNEMDVTLIYVIKVDTSNYGSFVSVFNSVNEKNTDYQAWPVGYFRETTNDQYRVIYKNLYEKTSESAVIFRTKKLNGAKPHITALVPIENSLGDVNSILCVQADMEELVSGRTYYLWNVAIATIILILFTLISSTFYFQWQYVNPLQKVKKEAERFAKNSVEPKEHLSNNISRIIEISSLAKSIDKMECEILNYIKNIKNITAEKEKIKTELKIASVIQESIVPTVFPESKNFDIYATMTPAREVGGDFYDFFMIDDDHIALVMADVSGKGVPAALFMMVTKILINERTLMGGTPAEILNFLNQRICDNNKAEMFVTVWLGILEISTGKIIASNAGHNNPAIYRQNELYEISNNKHGIVIGAMKDIAYDNFEIKLDKGDKIFLYTDGVTEAENADGKMFTVENMIKVLNKNKDMSPKETLNQMKSSIDEFVGDTPQFDDITMLCFELKEGRENKSSKTLEVDALNENLPQVLEFINDHLKEKNCSEKAQKQIDLAVEELFVNTAHYAYDKIGKVEISINTSEDISTIVLTDSGRPFNPLEREVPDTTLSANDRDIGGLGILLVKKNMDDIQYKFKNGKNILTLSKKIK